MLIVLATGATAQDLISRQAPSDRRMKDVENIKLKNLIEKEDLNNPASYIYSNWENNSLRGVEGRVGANFKIDLRGFCMPTPSRKITSKFGYRWRRIHEGLDIKVYTGDTIVAAFDGKVRMVKFERKGYGYYVVIRHPNGLETLYGHLSKQLVKENQIVKAGEVIGLGGNTGRSNGSHLHFETRLLGAPINPALLFDFENQDVTGDFYVSKLGDMKRGDWASLDVPSNEKYASAEEVKEAEKKAEEVEVSAAVKPETKTVVSKKKSSGNSRRTYRVKSGDSLYTIARKQGTTVKKLCELNNLSPKSIIRKGQVIRCS